MKSKMIIKKFVLKLIFTFFLSILFSAFSINNSYAVDPDEILINQKQELRARKIFKNIRCLVCQNQSIDESTAPLAKDLRILIRSKIVKGDNDKKIYKFLTDRYGDFILLKPSFKINTLLLWFLPVIFLSIGIFVLFWHNKKSKKN